MQSVVDSMSLDEGTDLDAPGSYRTAAEPFSDRLEPERRAAP